MSSKVPLTIPVRFSNHLAFAPDLTQLAVQSTLAEPGTTEIYALSDASLLASLDVTDNTSPWPCQLVYVGDSIVYLEFRDDDVEYQEEDVEYQEDDDIEYQEEDVRRWRVVRHRRPDWSREILAESIPGHAVMLGAIPGGFVVVAPDHFLLGTADGPLTGPVRHPTLADGEAMLLATDPASGRMAVTLDYTKRLVVFDANLQVLGETELHHDEADHAWFCGPETLVTCGSYNAIRSWRIEDDSLTVQGHTWLPKEDVRYSDYVMPLGLTAVPTRKLIAFARAEGPPLWYDARTLEIVAAPAAFGDRFPVWMSPGDRYAIVQDFSGLQVYDVRA